MSSLPHKTTVSLMSTLAVQRALVEVVIPRFEAQRHCDVRCLFDPTNVLQQRVSDGERADVLIATRTYVQRVADEHIVDASSMRALVRTGVGVAVAVNAARPSIDDVSALRSLLLDARSVAYSRTGASGVYFASLLQTLGIADQVNSRATVIGKGLTGECITSGQADVAIQQMSELAMVDGIAIAGPLPEAVQHYTDFDVALFRGGENPEASAALVEALFSPAARDAYEQLGLTVLQQEQRR